VGQLREIQLVPDIPLLLDFQAFQAGLALLDCPELPAVPLVLEILDLLVLSHLLHLVGQHLPGLLVNRALLHIRNGMN